MSVERNYQCLEKFDPPWYTEFLSVLQKQEGLENLGIADVNWDNTLTYLYDYKNEIIDIHLEQLLVYFLFTYFPGAVYDGEIYAKAQLAVYCTWMIWEIWMSRWLKNEKFIDLEEMTELVYRFSREVEHSDLNLRAVEEFLSKKWFLNKRK